MNYQSQHDLLDPDVPPPDEEPEDEGQRSGASDDAYVIGDGGRPAPSTIIITSGKPRSKPKRWAKPTAFALCALFVGLTAWNVTRILQGPPQRPTPSPFQMKQALYLGVMKIDAYRRAHGVTPDSIKDVDLPESFDYARVDAEHYTIAFRADGQKVEYSNRVAKEAFFGPSQAILSMGDGQ